MSDVNIAVVSIAFALYTLAIVGVGLYSARYARRSDEDYFLAGRSLGGWVAALSASASSESGWVTLGLVGLGIRLGRFGLLDHPGLSVRVPVQLVRHRRPICATAPGSSPR